MAGRRCLSSKITESDSFFALSAPAQALYLHLNMQADDDGFVNNAAGVSSRIKGGTTALADLVKSRFVLKFGDVYVIKHWRISNSLKNDRLKPLTYASIAARIWVKPNKSYTDHPVTMCHTLYELRTGTTPPADWIPNGFQMDSGLFPNGFLTEPNPTKPNITEPNLTEQKEFGVAFSALVKAYPDGRVGNAADAEEAFRQVIFTQEDISKLFDHLNLWKQSEQWNKEGGRFTPYLCNWLLRGTWREKPAKLAIPQGASGELGEAELEAIRKALEQPMYEEDNDVY